MCTMTLAPIQNEKPVRADAIRSVVRCKMAPKPLRFLVMVKLRP